MIRRLHLRGSRSARRGVVSRACDRRPLFCLRDASWPPCDRAPTVADVSECLEVARRLSRRDADDYLRSEGIDPVRAAAYVDVVRRLETSYEAPTSPPSLARTVVAVAYLAFAAAFYAAFAAAAFAAAFVAAPEEEDFFGV